MPFIKLTKTERKKLLVVVTCFALAVLAWFYMALSSKYIYTAKTVMVYKNLPAKRAFHALQSDTINIEVEGTGWQLLFARLRVKPQSLDINLTKLNTQDHIVLKEQLTSINRQLETSQRLISTSPDTLYFDFSKSYQRRIPIRLVSDLNFVKQHGLSHEITLKPKYVTIRGPEDVLRKFKYWDTDTLKLTRLSGNTSLRVPLRKNELKNISIFPSNVEVGLKVEEFTEKTIELPLKIYNNRGYLDVAVYPKKVLVTFLVALSAYKETDDDFIEAGVDLDEWKQKNYTKLPVRLKRFPTYCKLVSVKPSLVDFIIEK